MYCKPVMNYNIIVWRVKAEQKKCLFFLKRSLFFPDEKKKPVFFQKQTYKTQEIVNEIKDNRDIKYNR